ncbi:RlpA-like double-psi beta-barrel-protein domain-containing protein-containing protein [Rhodocollybia butyracea]|uniref:RlpA-like double-psi beta-barrel-protein domain-containing protein-containing protein n=1 Tax=Rhodocollybia butyracea TaxID=206335 RepID=A0A9P5U7P2_9AGAR|nr:RlpA-like double-psi beta-barrel-protein domain-containing protein-containing protein [Rhodocollybia butyracea]
MLSFSYLSLLYVAIFSLSFVANLERRQSTTGDLTWFDAGLGACGETNTASDYIVALNSDQWDGGSHCFAMITITHQGRSEQAQITDQCPTCSYGQLDLSEGLFAALSGGDPSEVGELYGATWFYGTSPTSSSSSQYTPTSTSQTPTFTPPPSTTSTSTSTTSTTSTSSSSSSASTTSSSSTSASATATSGPQVFSLLQQAVIQLAGFTTDAHTEN